MDHYDAKSALDELKEDAVLPHPVRLRRHDPAHATQRQRRDRYEP